MVTAVASLPRISTPRDIDPDRSALTELDVCRFWHKAGLSGVDYGEAMRRFASDKPDLRIPLELVDVAVAVKARGTSDEDVEKFLAQGIAHALFLP